MMDGAMHTRKSDNEGRTGGKLYSERSCSL
jgi:hypothetical protein